MTEMFSDENERNEMVAKVEYATRRVADGIGYGEGDISGQNSDPEDLAAADEAIESQGILVAIDVDDETGEHVVDDGCGDGRRVGLVERWGTTLKRSLNRYKVFGGGLVMGVAAKVGLGQTKGETLTETFNDSIEELTEKGIDFGAHTGHVTNETDSGCGAIDKSPKILENTVLYAEPIRDTISTLGISYDELDDDFEEIIANNAEMVEANRDKAYSGSKVMQLIRKAGKVIKDLNDQHLERRIVINTLPGYTVNQAIVRDVTGGRVQIFATDLPRLQEIAEKMYDDPVDQRKAFLAQVIYTLGVAATLTKGDLAVYVVEAAREREPQLAAA